MCGKGESCHHPQRSTLGQIDCDSGSSVVGYMQRLEYVAGSSHTVAVHQDRRARTGRQVPILWPLIMDPCLISLANWTMGLVFFLPLQGSACCQSLTIQTAIPSYLRPGGRAAICCARQTCRCKVQEPRCRLQCGEWEDTPLGDLLPPVAAPE